MPRVMEVGTSREQTLRALERLPTLSPMTMQLLARLAKRNCEVSEVASLIEKDAMLTAQVLSLANSALFGRKRSVISVRHAIPLIGIGAIRKFVLGTSISNLFSRSRSARSFSMTRFNLHSVATATLAEILSDDLPVDNPQAVFIAGLLHDVGILLIAVNLPRQFEDVLAMTAVSRASLIECEREVLGSDHSELSALIISRWKLADPVRWAARYHHAPEAATGFEPAAPGKIPLSQVIHQADMFVESLGMSTIPDAITRRETPALEFPGFNFSPERALARFEKEWKSLGDLFG
jgi:HD-like signal output (HDOD) protein